MILSMTNIQPSLPCCVVVVRSRDHSVLNTRMCCPKSVLTTSQPSTAKQEGATSPNERGRATQHQIGQEQPSQTKEAGATYSSPAKKGRSNLAHQKKEGATYAERSKRKERPRQMKKAGATLPSEEGRRNLA